MRKETVWLSVHTHPCLFYGSDTSGNPFLLRRTDTRAVARKGNTVPRTVRARVLRDLPLRGDPPRRHRTGIPKNRHHLRVQGVGRREKKNQTVFGETSRHGHRRMRRHPRFRSSRNAKTAEHSSPSCLKKFGIVLLPR